MPRELTSVGRDRIRSWSGQPAVTGAATDTLGRADGTSAQAWEVLPRPSTRGLEEGGTSGQSRQLEQRSPVRRKV